MDKELKLLIENISDIVSTITPQGVITYASPSVERVLGYKPAEMLGKNIFSFMPSEEVERVAPILAYAIEHPGIVQKVEHHFQHKNGTWRVLDAVGKVVKNEDGVLEAIVVSRDVTDQKKLEDHFRQSQKLEAIGKLAGGVAHDFNNLLTVIAGYAEMGIANSKPGDEVRTNFEEILKASKHIETLTQQLLAFSRRQIISPVVLNLNDIIQNAQSMVQPLMGERIHLSALLSKDPVMVKVDANQIEQVLINMVINAQESMPEGGQLMLETKKIILQQTDIKVGMEIIPGEYALLIVKDTGKGMADQTKAHLFEPFFTTKEKGKGTGLGLAMTYGIVKQLGGCVTVDSEMGKGTTMKIYFPIAKKIAGTPGVKAAEVKKPKGHETILLVEDEPLLRNLAVRVLSEHGFDVLVASDGVEALKAAEDLGSKPIDLLVTDVVMPHMGGKELAEKLAAKRPDLKVLFTSGYTDNAIVHFGVLDEGVVFLHKPFTPNILLNKINEILSKAHHH